MVLLFYLAWLHYHIYSFIRRKSKLFVLFTFVLQPVVYYKRKFKYIQEIKSLKTLTNLPYIQKMDNYIVISSFLYN
jgi:hypothetical protein